MPRELILKKLEQMKGLLDELTRLLAFPVREFVADLVRVRAAERNFQLAVDLASDINTQLLLEAGGNTPDTYRQSFIELGRKGIVERKFAEELAVSAGLRNILVHEYDFEEDYATFYAAVNRFIPLYRAYIKAVYGYVERDADSSPSPGKSRLLTK